MGKITKEGLKKLLRGRSSTELICLVLVLATKNELVDWILSHDIKNIERAMWEALGWKFEIEDE